MSISKRTHRGISTPFLTAAAIPKGSPVKLDTDTDYVVTSTSSNDAAIIGVTADESAAGGSVDVIHYGVAPVRVQTASGVAVGNWLMQGTDAGKAIKIAAVVGTNYNAFARVLVAPGADNDLVTCLICAGNTPAQG